MLRLIGSILECRRFYQTKIGQSLFQNFFHHRFEQQEFEFSTDIRRLAGSHKKAFEILGKRDHQNELKQAKRKRKEDLVTYFALGLFEKRQSYRQMPDSLKRDLKHFFDSYNHAINIATEAYSANSQGQFNPGHSWIIKRQWITALPPELRIYIGCATGFYGDIEAFQLVKIHFTSGKVSLMRYDDWTKTSPH